MTNTRFKVLFLASWYPNEDHSISGIFIKRHAVAVSKYCDVAVLYVHQSEHRTSTKVEYSIEDGIKTVRVYSRKQPFKNLLLRILYNMIFNNYIINNYKGLKIIRKEFGRPDIVHLNVVLPMGYIALILDVLKGIPFVLTEHTGPFCLHMRTYPGRIMTKIILNKARIIMPVSQALKRQMKNFYEGKNYKIIPNVIETNKFAPSLNYKCKNAKKKILHVSLLTDNPKNISGLLKAIKLLSEKREDFELHILGDGEDRTKFETLSTKLGIKNKFVYFHGMISNDEVANFMRASDFFILNSNHETFAIVCAEALASGLPVITTKCGGPEEYIDENVGIVIELGNQIALMSAIDFMLDNYSKYDPIMLHKYAEKKFGYDVVGEQLYSLYSDTLT